MYLSKNHSKNGVLFTVILLFILFLLFILIKFRHNIFDDQIGTWNGVSIYSNKQYEFDKNNESNTNYCNGVYTGIKWQCVEFARRYLIITRDITFENVTSAFEIPDAKFTTLNGNTVIPTNELKIGSLIVWPSYYELNAPHGHVAVVSSIKANGITVVEQNYNNDLKFSHNFSHKFSHRFIPRNNMHNVTILTV